MNQSQVISNSLLDATVQDLQLELVRRSSFNAFNGPRVVEALLDHRDLWVAVLMDRKPYWFDQHKRRLPTGWLIKLRDLAGNDWNVDTLFILTESVEKAREIEHLATQDVDNWGGEVHVHTDLEAVGEAIGMGPNHNALVTIWWD